MTSGQSEREPRILASRRGLCGSMLRWVVMTLRALEPERKTWEVTPSAMGVQFVYGPMRVLPRSLAEWSEDVSSGAASWDGDDGEVDEDFERVATPASQAALYPSWHVRQFVIALKGEGILPGRLRLGMLLARWRRRRPGRQVAVKLVYKPW